jgi:hypothetical protein
MPLAAKHTHPTTPQGEFPMRLLLGLSLIVLAVAPVQADDTAKAAATRKILKTKKITVDFKEDLLKDVMDEIKEKAPGIKIMLDTKGGVSQNIKVSFSGKDKTVEEVLNGLFEKSDLGYYIISVDKNAYDGLIKVTKGGERGYEKGKEPK